MPWLSGALESVAEAEVLRMLSSRGLPAPTSQLRKALEGGRVSRLDFAWPAQLVALEVDGFQYHDGPDRFVADRHRGNLLAGAGWQVLRTTLHEVRSDPEALCHALRLLLAI
jgi:very-short-patch-repair endonuclease